MQINLLQELISANYDPKMSADYLSFIEEAISHGKSSRYKESHHILPNAIFPQFGNLKKFPENLAKISAYDHFVAHYHLAKLTSHPSAIYALNCMNRIKHKLSEDELFVAANLYEEFKTQLSDIISKANTGKIRSQEVREAISKRVKGTLIVKDTLGNKMRVSVTDPRYLSGELIFHKTGSKHTQKTLEKMKAASAKRGNAYTNLKSGKIKYFVDSPDLSQWEIGVHYSADQLFKITNACVKKKFWTHKITGEQVRSEESPGNTWELGRKKFDNKINNSLAIYNIKIKKFYSKDKREKLSDWELYKNKHAFLLTIDNTTYIHHDESKISSKTGIPKEMVDLWGRNNLWGRGDKNLLKRSFSNISNTEEKSNAMNKFLGTKWGDINLIKISPLDVNFPDVSSLVWLE